MITLLVALSGPSLAQGLITTIAGNGRLFRGNGGPALAASLGQMLGIDTDAAGNVYATDSTNNVLVKITPAGTITVIAGNNIPAFSGDGGPATSASLNTPAGVRVDPAGNIYIADSFNMRVRKITPDGTITTVAGGAASGNMGRTLGDGGPATSAFIFRPRDVALDRSGNLYIADNLFCQIRKVTPDGIISTIAGKAVVGCGTGYSGDGGPAVEAEMGNPLGIDVDGAGNVYIADNTNHIRKVTPDGIITTIGGNGSGGAPSGNGGPAVEATIPFPQGVRAEADGTLYIPNGGGVIRKIDPNGIILPVAGGGTNTGEGVPAGSAQFNNATQVALFAGNLYVAEAGAGRIRRVTPDGTVNTIAGAGLGNFSGDNGPGTSAALSQPYAVAVDTAGNVYIADSFNHRIRRVAPNGRITTVAGSGQAGFSGDGGQAANAALNTPQGVVLDPAGNLYIADSANNRVRRVAPNGVITTVAGGRGGFSGDGGPATSAALSSPRALALDTAGNLYIADFANRRVRKVTDGAINTVAGNGSPDATSGDDGPATSASITNPTGVAVDAGGNVYISQSMSRVRKVTPDGIINTVAGGGSLIGNGVKATDASIASNGVAVDAAGTFYVSGGIGTFKVGSDGLITGVAGNYILGYSGDGGPATNAQINQVRGMAFDTAGNLYLADSGNDRIRKILASPPPFSANPAAVTFTATAGATEVAPQQITITSPVTGLPFTAASSAGDWLSLSSPLGSAPSVITLGANLQGLAPGTYRGNVTITAPDANPKTQTLSVTLTINALNPPRLVVESAGLSFALNQGAAPGAAQFTVANRGTGSLNFALTAATDSGGPWLSATPSSGALTSTPASITVTANPAGLNAGTYSGRIVVSGSTTGQSATVPVTMTVSAVRQTILLSQTGITFTAVADGGVVPPQTFGILNTRQGAMSWTISTSTLSGGANWLSATPASGASEANALKVPLVEVGVRHQGLAPGDYYGQVRVTAPGADNSPQTVSVVLKVLPPGSNPGPLVRPTGLIFTSISGTSPPGSQEVLVSNLTSTPITFTSGRLTLDDKAWFVSIPPSETVSPSGPTRLTVQTDTTILAPGIRRGVLTLLFSDGAVQTINLLSVLLGSGGAKGAVSADGCVPSTLLPLFTVLAPNSTAVAGWPTPVEVKIVDDCGDPMTRGSVVASFSNGDGAVPLAPLGEGRWSGTWQPRRNTPAGVTVTVTAQVTDLRIRGTVQATVGLQTNPNVPVVGQAAVVNAASFGPQALTAPGSIISIFGTRLSDTEIQARTLPLQTELGGVTVALAGQPLPLLYASGQQVNAVIPYGIQVNAQHQVVVRRGDSYSVPESITVAAAQPAIFTLDQSGKGQGLIFNGSNLADAANPARAADVVVAYATGLGEVSPAVPSGAAAPAVPLSRVVTPVEVRIGGQLAQVLFAGLAPGFVGLYQLNVQIPTGVAAGSSVPFQLLQNGTPGNAVTLAVR